MSNPETLHLPLGEKSYDILIGRGLIAQAGAWLKPVLKQPRVIIVADEGLTERFLTPLQASLETEGIASQAVTVAPGEASKSFEGFETLINALLALKPDRRTTIVVLGGGVIGDLAGFAASVLLRGVDYVQIPTSLLAQVDSSVGGKTGINTRAGKNLVGSFHQPRRVLIDTDTLRFLPPRHIRAGYAEIVKYGALGSESFFAWLEAHGEQVLALEETPLVHAIKTCCGMKAELVEWDEKEQDMRALLNLGHTFGHALEAETGYNDRLVHGEAVAIGMVMAARLSTRLGLCGAEVEDRLRTHLRACGLPVSPLEIDKDDWHVNRLCAHFASDKKVRDGRLVFVVLKAIGEAELVRDVDPALAREVVEAFLDKHHD